MKTARLIPNSDAALAPRLRARAAPKGCSPAEEAGRIPAAAPAPLQPPAGDPFAKFRQGGSGTRRS